MQHSQDMANNRDNPVNNYLDCLDAQKYFISLREYSLDTISLHHVIAVFLQLNYYIRSELTPLQ